MKIAVRVTNWIGDVIMNLPALEALRAAYPRAEIVAIARPWVAQLLQFRPDLIDRCLSFDDQRSHRGVSGFWKFCRQLRKEKFALGVVFTKHLKGALMMAAAGVPQRVGILTPETRWFLKGGVAKSRLPKSGRHQSENYLDVLRHGLGVAAPKASPRLMVDAQLLQNVFKKLLPTAPRPLLGIHAGAAYGTAKRWSAEGYAEVITQFLQTTEGSVVLLGVTAEADVNRVIVDTVQSSRLFNLCGNTTLQESLVLIGGCDVFLSNDSGLMHAAAAFQIPQVAIYGPTDVHATFPLSQVAKIISHPVACSPCFKRHCPIGHECMKGVGGPEVWSTVQSLLPELPKS